MKALDSFFFPPTSLGIVIKDFLHGAEVVIKWQDRAPTQQKCFSSLAACRARCQTVGGSRLRRERDGTTFHHSTSS